MTAIEERSTVTDIATKAPAVPAWPATSGSMPDQPHSGNRTGQGRAGARQQPCHEVVGLTGQTRLVKSNSLNASMWVGSSNGDSCPLDSGQRRARRSCAQFLWRVAKGAVGVVGYELDTGSRVCGHNGGWAVGNPV
jgi:hypothetical protein